MKPLNYIKVLPPLIWGVVALSLIWFAYKAFVKPADKYLNTDINKNQLTYSESQYHIFADAIEAATSGIGDDEEAIYNVFKQMKNDNDVLMLISAFDRRSYVSGFGLYYNATLQEILNGNLNSSELSDINKILSDNGITIII